MMLTNSTQKQSNTLLIQLIKYVFVGGAAFLVDFGVLYLLSDKLHLYYLFSAEISFILGLLVNYALSTLWVFDSHAVRNPWLEFLIFATIGLLGLGLNAIIMWSLTDLAHFYYLGSKLVSTAVVFFFNFFARKFTLFR